MAGAGAINAAMSGSTLSAPSHPGRALPEPEGHKVQLGRGTGACYSAEMRAKEEEDAGAAGQARRAEPGCAPGLRSAVPPRQGYRLSRSKCLRWG